MRKFLTILFVVASFASIGQNIVPRASAANTVSDARLQAQLNFFIPRYNDTATANASIGIDSLGAIIFTYDVNNFWIRVGGPKHWQQGSGGGTVLPDGVYSGGQVAWSGTGYDYIVSAATFVLGGVIYNSPQTTITLPPADPALNRIDVIGLSFSGASGVAISVTGVPAANPFEPSTNPQTFIRRSIVTVVANTTQPPNIDQTIIYDEGDGEPGEWTPSSTGATDFLDQDNPYHLLRDAMITSIDATQRIMLVNDDTIQSAARSSLVLFINFQTVLPAANNINVQLLFQGNPVSPLLPITKYGVLNNINLFYQMAAIPFSEFATGNIIFDEIDIVPTGASPFPVFYLDYIQMQSGLAPIVQIPNQKFGDPQGDNFSTITRSFNFNNTDFTFNNINKFVSRVAANSDSAFLISRTDGNPLLRVDGITNTTNVFQFNAANDVFIVDVAAARVTGNHFLQLQTGAVIQGYQQPATILRSYPTIGAASTQINLKLTNDTSNASLNPDSLTYKLISANLTSLTDGIEREKLYINGQGQVWSTDLTHTTTADTVMVKKDGFYKGITIPEFKTLLASGGTVTSVATNAATGITGGTITTTGTLTIDTTLIATRAWVGAAGAPGTVSSFIFTDGSGFDGTVNTATTTPTLSLTTSLTQNRLPFIGASGALSQDAGFTVDATNKRIISYLSPPAGTALSNTSPLKFTSGTLMSSPETGAWEFDGTHVYFTIGGVRVQIDNPASSGVTSITGTANQVISSAATGAVTLSLPQSIATTSTPTFRSLTLGGTAATTPLTFTTNTDAAAAAGRWYYNTTRLGFARTGGTINRFPLTNDVTPTAGQGIFGNGTDYTVGTYSALNNSVLVAPSAAGVTLRTNSIVQTLSGTSVTMNINNGENAVWTLTASGSSLAITNPVAGRLYFVNVTQDATGSRTITTYPTGTVWYSGSAPVLKTGAGNVNTLAFYYNGSSYYGFDWGSGGGGGGFVNPMTTIGDMIIGAGGGAAARLAGNATTAPMVLMSTGTGAAATSQTWQATFTGRTTSATLDFPNTAAQSSSEMTIAVTGAVVGDVVTIGTDVSNTNSNWSARVASAGFVAIRFNNYSAGAQNPVSGTFKVIVWQ